MLLQLVAGWLRYARVYLNQRSNKVELGQGLVEYALILVMVSVVMVVLLSVMGPSIRNIFANILVWIQGAEAGNS
jgi:pilus assembly protein Flp/PilA